jgi:hypothetical protein
MMENIAAASGHSELEAVREEMQIALKAEHGRHACINFEPIPNAAMQSFIEWIESDD